MGWTHDDLREDLASHLANPRRMLWQDVQLGPSGSARPDVFTLEKSFAHPRPMAYEIKVSMADFRADATVGKWTSYLKFACGVYFAVPPGLLTKADVPAQAGLLVRGEKGWRAVKKPVLSATVPPFNAMQKLLIDGLDREYRTRERQRWASWKADERLKKQYGKDVTQVVSDLQRARKEVARLQALAAQERAQTDRLREDAKKEGLRAIEIQQRHLDSTIEETRRALNLSDDASVWVIAQELRRLRGGPSQEIRLALAALKSIQDKAARTLEQVQ